MSPSGATATRPRTNRRPSASRRRAVARRRRRVLLTVVIAALALFGAVMVFPIARKAVNELGLPLRYQDVIRAQAAEKHLDPALIAGVIYAETKFYPRTSSAGALGPMQLMPETAQFLARRSGATTFKTSDLAIPEVNIAYGSYLLRYLLDKYHGNTLLALAAYNAGPANVDKWVADARAAGGTLGIGDIPFPETRDYVQRVLQAQQDYRRAYPTQLGYR
jgi:soluble lytic murein transglycosylase